jgi:hypothetical protein
LSLLSRSCVPRCTAHLPPPDLPHAPFALACAGHSTVDIRTLKASSRRYARVYHRTPSGFDCHSPFAHHDVTHVSHQLRVHTPPTSALALHPPAQPITWPPHWRCYVDERLLRCQCAHLESRNTHWCVVVCSASSSEANNFPTPSAEHIACCSC